ncbi:hypothetical protein FB567DRAFT_20009 [Paraphoma chrysanthemicola]|uniref:Uncharacterized protein n=1 Tax=Paraphoma chrysanthemicola TaxID=798071 RepID=A0A8K0W3X3_9PLEO|nr:hypothetical protein FB567DRAFT_20009 [Paraphoma chrysanthemicola]
MTTKILIYYFLVERAYIVGGSMRPRLKTKLWLFNCLFMLLPYTIFVILNFIFRITYINAQGVCIIGMQKIAMLPLITFEVVVNVYLTLLFVIPIRKLHSYKSNTNPALNRMAFRSFVGSCATLTTSVVNLTVLMVLKGEPGWICLMVCNADILFCVLVLHWVSSKEQKDEDSAFRSRSGDGNAANAGKAPVGVGTIGSNRSRSRRVSLDMEFPMDDERGTKACEADVSKSMEMSIKTLEGAQVHVREETLTHQPSNASLQSLQTALRMPATITTECTAEPVPSGIISVFHRRGSSWDDNAQPGIREDEVELNRIHVETIQTREVEGKRSQSENSLDDGCEWVESRKGVVGEGMV